MGLAPRQYWAGAQVLSCEGVSAPSKWISRGMRGGARRNVAAAHTFAAANPLLACFLGDGVSAALARSPDGTGGGVGTTTLGRLELLGLAPSAGRLVDLPLDGVFDVEVPWNAVTERGALPLFKGGHFLRSGREPAVPVVEVGLSLRVAAAAA